MKKDINIGYKIGVIEVIGCEYVKRFQRRMYKCKCNKCGNIFYQSKSNILHRLLGKGCKNCKATILITHGMKKTRIYNVWKQLKHRCNCSQFDYSHWKNYAGRGITVCDEWQNNFMSFYNWAISNGWNEDSIYESGKNKLSIDRIDNDKGYSPENCRIVTFRENQYNKRTTVFGIYEGKKYNVLELSKLLNLPTYTIRYRIKHNKELKKREV